MKAGGARRSRTRPISPRRTEAAATAVVGGAAVLPTHVQADAVVVFRGGRIVAAGSRAATPIPTGAMRIDARGQVVIPGLVDLQVNGFGGVDVFGASRVELAKMGKALAAHGVTSFIPTLVTSPFPTLLRALEGLAQSVSSDPKPRCAESLGLHLEGPFLSGPKRGAHPASELRDPRPAEVERILHAMGNGIRFVTLAPELPGAPAAIRALRKAGVLVAIGHSQADAAACRRAVAAGARHVTHLFNTMPPIHHRAPGMAGFTLGSGKVTAGIIADGHHVAPEMLATAWRALGSDRLALVSDAIAPAGLRWRDGAAVRLKSGLDRVTIRTLDGLPRAENQDGLLAGSVVSLADAVRFAVHGAEIPLFDAVRMASETPARIAGSWRRKGALAPGLDADVVVLDTDLRVTRVWVRGTPVETNAAAPAAGARRRLSTREKK